MKRKNKTNIISYLTYSQIFGEKMDYEKIKDNIKETSIYGLLPILSQLASIRPESQRYEIFKMDLRKYLIETLEKTCSGNGENREVMEQIKNEIDKSLSNTVVFSLALTTLGRGLHALQDMDAHVDYGRDSPYRITIPHHDQGGYLSYETFDDPNYDIIKQPDGNYESSPARGVFSQRYLNTLNSTETYLNAFMNGIYGNGSLVDSFINKN